MIVSLLLILILHRCYSLGLIPDMVYTRNKTTFSFEQGAQAKVDVVLSSADLTSIPGCNSEERKEYWMHNDRDARPGIRVTTCGDRLAPKKKSNAKMWGARRGMKLAACVPTLFSDRTTNNAHLWDWLAGWMTLNHALGVEHFFVYTIGQIPPGGRVATNAPYTLLDVSWATNIRKRPRGPPMWYYGQYWTINDCLYRNKALGTTFLLHQDVDEVYTSTMYPSFTALIDAYFQSPSGSGPGADYNNNNKIMKDVDSVFIGNYRVQSRPCLETGPTAVEWISDATRRRLECFVRRDPLPECRPGPGGRVGNPYMCPTWRGRRKHIDRVSTLALTKVHKTLRCKADGSAMSDRPCREVNVDARQAWLDHVQGAPYNSTRQCRCTSGL